jgi:hypothetical protein
MSTIPQPVQSVLDLFVTCLADVRFADVDAATLARAASEVEAAAERLAAAQVTLDAASSTLKDRQEALLQQAHRALAYARVYAESDEALSAQLLAISLPRQPRRPASDALVLSNDPQPVRRERVARPRKAAADDADAAAPSAAE